MVDAKNITKVVQSAISICGALGILIIQMLKSSDKITYVYTILAFLLGCVFMTKLSDIFHKQQLEGQQQQQTMPEITVRVNEPEEVLEIDRATPKQ